MIYEKTIIIMLVGPDLTCWPKDKCWKVAKFELDYNIVYFEIDFKGKPQKLSCV